jgi:ankyrin repeat protein
MAVLSGCSADLDKRLVAAANDGDLEQVRVLLQRGANVNYQIFDTGTTPLIAAARKGHVHVATALLAAGANINAIDHDVGAALYWAAFEGQQDMVKFMLERGAKLNCNAASAAYLIDIIRKRNFIEVERLIGIQFQREGFSSYSQEKKPPTTPASR